MRVTPPIELSNLKFDDPNFTRYLSQILSLMLSAINGELTFTDNFKTQFIEFVFDAANQERAIRHTLNKIPFGYLVVGAQAATQIYDSTTPNTPQVLYVKSTVATTVRLLVF